MHLSHFTLLQSNSTSGNETTASLCHFTTRHGWSYVHWMAYAFGQCIYTPLEQASFYVGLVALLCYAISTIPYVLFFLLFFLTLCLRHRQMLINCVKRKGSGFSIYFLLFFFLADSLSFTGTIFSNQLLTQVCKIRITI